jgi:hypothetical protein
MAAPNEKLIAQVRTGTQTASALQHEPTTNPTEKDEESTP